MRSPRITTRSLMWLVAATALVMTFGVCVELNRRSIWKCQGGRVSVLGTEGRDLRSLWLVEIPVETEDF